MDANYVLGIDIGGTTIGFGFVKQNGEIINRSKLKTSDYHDFESFATDLFEIFDQLPGKENVTAIGIGAPNGNFYNGSIDFAPNLNWGDHIPVTQILERVFHMPATITNDANAAACGEKFYGGAKEMKDFTVITLGTGVGSGIYVAGNLLQGKYGFGGELGHIIVEENGRKCGCGKYGCLETYTSVTGIIRTAHDLMEKSTKPSVLRSQKVITGKDIEQAALAGDWVGMQAFKITSDYLGKALANLITIFDPEAIFLNGGLAQSGALIFEPTKAIMEENLMKIFKGKVKLLPSELPDADAAILGAAAIGRV
jgi:glucokinase